MRLLLGLPAEKPMFKICARPLSSKRHLRRFCVGAGYQPLTVPPIIQTKVPKLENPCKFESLSFRKLKITSP